MRWYESYMTRRVPLNMSAMTPAQAAQTRLNAIRDLMRMEMPERWNDVINGPISGIPEPSLHKLYNTKYNATKPGPDHAMAKCLYLWVMTAIPDAKTMFSSREIGIVDGDGWQTFIDGWGHPISFLRWAPGFSQYSDIQVADPLNHHDPFDYRNVDAAGYQLFPLIYAGVIGKDSNGYDDYGISPGLNVAPTLTPCSSNGQVGIMNTGIPLFTNHHIEQK